MAKALCTMDKRTRYGLARHQEGAMSIRLSELPDRSRPSLASARRSAGTGRGGERISNYTVDSHHGDEVLHSPPPEQPRGGAGWRRALAGPALRPPAVAEPWLERLGPFELPQALAPVPILWAAFLVERMQREAAPRWDLATGAFLLIGAGCLGRWQSLEWSRAQPAARQGPWSGHVAAAAALAAPIALLVAGVATLRGQHLAQRAPYVGGLFGASFTLAIDLQAARREVAFLPALGGRNAADALAACRLVSTLSTAALVGLFGLAPRFDRWPWLLGTSILLSSQRLFSLCGLREELAQRAQQAAEAQRGALDSLPLTERIARTDSGVTSLGADLYVPWGLPARSASSVHVDAGAGRAL